MFTVSEVRQRFPSLRQTQDGQPVVFFDNPGGTQVPQAVIDAMAGYLLRDNANHDGAFATSRRSDRMLYEAHRAMADMLGAASPQEIVFGANMTTLTLHISRSLGRWLQPGDEIIVTRLDHDANIAPWLLLARDVGATVRWADFDPEDGTLNMDSLRAQLSERTRIVACGYASNALGTINDVATVVTLAHQVGALAFIDAVQYAPHGPIDVAALGCDFLACSAYKFFGPHVGILYGRRDLLERLPAYKVRPAPDTLPDRFETGTLNHEGIAGVLAAVEYLAQVEPEALAEASRRQRILASMASIRQYERELCARLIAGLQEIPGLRIYGITDPAQFDWRVPTVSFRLGELHPRWVAEELGKRGIFVWDGNYYALAVTERLGLEEKGGMVRVGLVHYNTADEVDRLLDALRHIAG